MTKIDLYNMDNMELMKKYPNKYFELAIVDPPYGIGEDGSNNKSRGKLTTAKNYKAFSGNDKEAPSKEYFNELIRVSKNQIIFGANHFIEKIPFNSSCWIVWDKNNGDNDFADCELAYTSFKTAVRKFKFTWNGMLQENMKDKEFRIHPTQKPTALYRFLLEKYAKQGDKILDTHLGSMSIVQACIELGFDITGCELDQHYFLEGKNRIDKFVSQLNLFQEQPEINYYF